MVVIELVEMMEYDLELVCGYVFVFLYIFFQVFLDILYPSTYNINKYNMLLVVMDHLLLQLMVLVVEMMEWHLEQVLSGYVFVFLYMFVEVFLNIFHRKI